VEEGQDQFEELAPPKTDDVLKKDITIQGTASFHKTEYLWTPNPDGPRSIAQARAIAEDSGADIADDVHFIVLEDSAYQEILGILMRHTVNSKLRIGALQ
jgi:hypothetical protein